MCVNMVHLVCLSIKVSGPAKFHRPIKAELICKGEVAGTCALTSLKGFKKYPVCLKILLVMSHVDSCTCKMCLTCSLI